jgi:hypothetical protein
MHNSSQVLLSPPKLKFSQIKFLEIKKMINMNGMTRKDLRSSNFHFHQESTWIFCTFTIWFCPNNPNRLIDRLNVQ